MKFGIYSSIANPPHGDNLDRCIDEVIAEACLAEQCGFDSCFFGEHHQDKDGFLPSPLIVASAVAARTQRLKVGTSVILLPLHHPVHVAEDVTTLDLVSKGRVILGVGVGYQPADFQAFGVPFKQRAAIFEESMAVMRHCFSGERFSFDGKHYRLESMQMRPLPYQRPSPPIWIGASARSAIERAGRLGDAFVSTPSSTMTDTLTQIEWYKAAASAAGRPAEVILMRDAWVAATREEAEQVYGPEVMQAYRYYWENRLADFSSLPEDAQFTLDLLATDRLIMGDPESCVQEFKRWSKATGAEYFVLRLRHAHSGGPPHQRIMAAIELFGKSVIPHCQ